MTKPLVWMREVRDHVCALPEAERPSRDQLLVLDRLALRMRADGTGFASHVQLAKDADVSERTARRATRWARDVGFLVQTSRGHRLGDGKALASTWVLTTPQPASPDRLTDDEDQPVTADLLSHLNRTEDGLNRSDDGLNRSQVAAPEHLIQRSVRPEREAARAADATPPRGPGRIERVRYLMANYTPEQLRELGVTEEELWLARNGHPTEENPA